jgi:hypothetical protein
MAYMVRAGTGAAFRHKSVKAGEPTNKKVLAQFAPIGGYEVGKHLAMAASAVYGAMALREGKQDAEEWPRGWTPVADAFYDTESQGKGQSKVVGDVAKTHAVAVLQWQGAPAGPFKKGDLLVACRGTVTPQEWKIDFNLSKGEFVHPTTGDVIGKTHAGFRHYYDALFLGKLAGQPNLFEGLIALLEKSAGEAVYFTGHSLGGAMCHLGALGFHLYLGSEVQTKLKSVPEVRMCSFAAPRVCNAHTPPNKLFQAFNKAQAPSARKLSGVRVVNMEDPVPNTPGQSFAALRSLAAGVRGGSGASGAAKGATTGLGVVAVSPLAVVADVFNAASAPLQGRWSHPSINKLRFKDNGRGNGGHPHSMDLYKHILVDAPFRLALDLQDRLMK